MLNNQFTCDVINWLCSNINNEELLKSLQLTDTAILDQLKRIGSVTLEEVPSRVGNPIKLDVDKDVLPLTLNRIEENRIDKLLIQKAIQLGASNEVMRRFAGISSKECSRIRQQCHKIQFDQDGNINLDLFFKNWFDSVSNPKEPSLLDLVQFSEQYGIPISKIWRILNS